jgi:hypothetical protein
LDSAWEQVKLGNVTQGNYCPVPFPRSVLLKKKDRFQADDSRIAAALLWTDFSVVELAKRKDKYTEVCAACALGAPLELADDYLVRARRMGQARDQQTGAQLVAMWYALELLEYIGDECLVLSEGQSRERDALVSELKRVQENASDTMSQFQAPAGLQSPVSGFVLAVRYDVVPGVWNDIKLEMECAEQNCALFDILDPPPFAIWARGELIGLDTSGVVLEEGEAAGDS